MRSSRAAARSRMIGTTCGPISTWAWWLARRWVGCIADSSRKSTTFGRGWSRRWRATGARCGLLAIHWAARWRRFAPAVARCLHIRSNPQGLFTFGSPRIGSRRYVNYVQMEAYRWVNNNDIITQLPPAWLGFRHKGQEVYLNAYGKIRRLTAWQRVKDRWRGFVRGLREGSFDHFADHSIGRYIEHIQAAVAEEEAATAPWRRPRVEPVAMPLRAAA